MTEQKCNDDNDYGHEKQQVFSEYVVFQVRKVAADIWQTSQPQNRGADF